MLHKLVPAIGFAVLTGCGDGQPLFEIKQDETDLEIELPGSDEDGVLLRYEDRGTTGGGFVQEVVFDEDTGNYIIDNIAFDGENEYTPGAAVPTLGSYEVFDAAVSTADDLTGNPISQIANYRAIIGQSTTMVGTTPEPRTSFALVRTGGYFDYGFGGFLYQRNGSVTLPSTGQATFSGDYAGTRVFQNGGGLEFTTGAMTIDIDFEDFNANTTVKGNLTGRAAFEVDGTPISLGGMDELVLPTVSFVIKEGTTNIADNGEITGELTSAIVNDEGALEVYESGQYYAVIAGDATDVADGGEIVGIIVIESEDPRYEGVTAQETGGFILYR